MRNPFFPFASGIYFFKLRMRSLGKLNVSRERWMEKWIYGLWFRSILTVSYLDRLAILVLGFFSSFELCTKFLGLGSLDVWLLRERNAVVAGSHDSTPTPELPVGACWLIFSVWESGGWSDLCSSLGVTHLQLLKVCFRIKLKETKKLSCFLPHPNWVCMGEGNGVKSGKKIFPILLSNKTIVCGVF